MSLSHAVVNADEANFGFLDNCLSLFMRTRSGHMGSDLYHDHAGIKSLPGSPLLTQSMSGIRLWEQHAKNGSIPIMARRAYLECLPAASSLIGDGLPILELGPGSMEDARHLIAATCSKEYIPADFNPGMLGEAKRFAATLTDCHVRPTLIDIFDSTNEPILDEPALAALLGLTISNIPGPVPKHAPRQALIRALSNLKKPIGKCGGFFLVATHAEMDGSKNESLYNERCHAEFGTNFLFRIQSELPSHGFDPSFFEYAPVWHERCGLIAHCVRATKTQSFFLGNSRRRQLSISAGDLFHYNNSFKYSSQFFESCAATAGLNLIESWPNENNMVMYLFGVPSSYERYYSPRSRSSSSLYSIAA